MNRRSQYPRVLIAFCSLIILIFINTCQEIDLTREALVQTDSHSIGDGTIAMTGTIIDVGEGISDHGFVVSNAPDPLVSSGTVLRLGSASGTGQFTTNLSDAEGGLNLYFRAFATTGGETIYGKTKTFSTPDLIVLTNAASIQTSSSVTMIGSINSLGFESVTDHGFFWADEPTPRDFSENKISLGVAINEGAFNYLLAGLTPYTDYYFVAYAKNDSETKFGDVRNFKIENVWTQIGNFVGSARHKALAFSLEGFGYITGGEDAGSINDFYQFSPDPESWIHLSSGNSPVYGTAFTIGNKAYVFNEMDLFEFDPDNGMWVDKANFPGTARWNVFAFSIGNRGYVGSGAYHDGTAMVHFNDLWEFDPQDDITNGTDINGNPMGSWTQKIDFQGTARQFGGGFSITTYGYVCGGDHNSDNLGDLWEYDPFSTDNGTDANGNPMGAWSQKTDYPGPPGSVLVSFVIRNKAYIFKDNELWQYNPETENWMKMADFPGQARYAPVGFAINNIGYVGTGVTSVYMNDFWEYLPYQ